MATKKITSRSKRRVTRRKNPADEISDAVYDYLNIAERDFSKSIELVEAFSGLEADKAAVVKLPPMPKSLMTPGFVVGIIYAAKRDEEGDGVGEMSVFEHIFADGDAPILGISPDGRNAYLIGGNYKFGDRGFVDDSDKRNHYEDQGQGRLSNPIKVVKRKTK